MNVEGHLTEAEAEEAIRAMGFFVKKVQALPSARHVFTHITWHLSGYEITVDALDREALGEDLFAPTGEELRRDYSIPGAFAAYKI